MSRRCSSRLPTIPSNASCTYPVCFINGNLEFPAPAVLAPDPATYVAQAPADQLVVFVPAISSTVLTMWIVSVVVIILLVVLARGRAMVPGRAQNFIEWVWEAIEGFGTSLGGPEAKPYIGIFAGFFLYILLSNWSGLIPPIGKVEYLRAPTSDVNITIGLGLTAFVFFEYQGFRHLGVRGYLSKFFPFGEFRKGIGSGIIAMFVGLIELLLEFVKPVTLSMRLFGNIYGGEVALGVMTALTVAIIPMAIIALELMLEPGAGAHLLDPDPHVHPGRDRASRRRTNSTRAQPTQPNLPPGRSIRTWSRGRHTDQP